MMRCHAYQRGVALLTSMLVVTLAAIIASELVWQQHLNIRRAESLLAHEQARLYALSAESWAIDILTEDAQAGPGDDLCEGWAQDIPPLPVDEAVLDGAIEDLEARFNLNNLVNSTGVIDQPALEQFKRLLRALELDENIADAVADWIDADQIPTGQGAEDDRYTGLEVPYRTANMLLTTTSELMAVDGIDEAAFKLLRPHIAALPQGSKMNINTATPPVLLSLSENLTMADIDPLLGEDVCPRFTDVSQAFANADIDPLYRSSLMALDSRYFGVEIVVALGRSQLSMYSLLERTNEEGTEIIPRLRSFGVDE